MSRKSWSSWESWSKMVLISDLHTVTYCLDQCVEWKKVSGSTVTDWSTAVQLFVFAPFSFFCCWCLVTSPWSDVHRVTPHQTFTSFSLSFCSIYQRHKKKTEEDSHQTRPAGLPAPRWPNQSLPVSPMLPSSYWPGGGFLAAAQRQSTLYS